MSEPFIGEIKMFGGNFAPRGYAFCNGQLLAISQNTALFSILGTTYGGDGRVTFGLPDLRGRVPVHQGQGPGLSNYDLGQVGGTESHTLIVNELAAHTHTVSITPACSTEDADAGSPKNNFPAVPGGGGAAVNAYTAAATPGATMGAGTGTANPTGGSQPFSILQPYLAINFIIAVEGIFPSRN